MQDGGDPMGGPVDQTGRHAARIDQLAKRQINRFRQAARGVHPRHCPLCGYYGKFPAFGAPPRFDARCGACGSLERHRLFKLYIDREAPFAADQSVLHVAPEAVIRKVVEPKVARYESADLSDRLSPTHQVNIEETGLPDGSYDRIICSHVIEHVDDTKALAEMFRLLTPGGIAFLATPVCEGWAETYENPEITTRELRKVHFAQGDHVRYYGRDVRDRIRAAGFELEEFPAVEPDVLTYGLMRGETLFIARKPVG